MHGSRVAKQESCRSEEAVNLITLQIGIVLFCACGATLDFVFALPARVDRILDRITLALTKSSAASDSSLAS
jgi:hypothetical protein